MKYPYIILCPFSTKIIPVFKIIFSSNALIFCQAHEREAKDVMATFFQSRA